MQDTKNSRFFPVPLVGKVREAGKGVVKEKSLFNNPLSAFAATSPAGGEGSGGFTLIELLVVVLIIGILAAVAVPQYQKAVMKSRFSEWVVYVASFDKALDAWVLGNGYPEDTVMFTGENAVNELDMDMFCLKQESDSCVTKNGRYGVGCASSSCWIDFGTRDTDAVPFAGTGQGAIWTSKYANGSYNGQRVLVKVPTDKTFRKIVCEWWVTHHGKGRMKEDVISACAEIGI